MKNSTTLLIIVSVLLITSCDRFENEHGSKSEEVIFSSGKFEVVGELLYPEAEGSFPLVVMVHGDGPAYMSYFSRIKESFLKAGYATLMWDKPGFGKSTGKFSEKHLRKERAEILLDAISAMEKHSMIKSGKIGVWGISQAGYVIPIALEKTDAIKFMILVGCGGESGIRQTAYYIKSQLMCIGVSEEQANIAEQNFIGLFSARTFDEYYQCAKPLVDDPAVREMGFVTAIWSEDQWKPKKKTDEGFFNPMTIFEETKIPAMVFFGELDKNVNPIQGMKAFQDALSKAENKNFIIELIEGTDHNIIISETGCAAERYARSGKGWSDYDSEYLKMMEEWLLEFKNQ